MCRLVTRILALGMLGLVVGCHCMHGVCDCDVTGPCCPPWHHPGMGLAPTEMPTPPAPIKPAPAPEAPKPDK